MYEDTITFQLATNQLSKIALRLECLFRILHETCEQTLPSIHRYAIKILIEIMDIIDKPELKGRFVKELLRIEHVLVKHNTSIEKNLHQDLLDQIQILANYPGCFSEMLENQAFLKALRQVHQPNSQECEFNSPQVNIWLDLPARQRQEDLQGWLDLLVELENTVNIYLAILRHSCFFTSITAINGFYQYNLPARANCNLIQLKIQKDLHLVPKLQLGHTGLTIRLHRLHSLEILSQSAIDMQIAVSQI